MTQKMKKLTILGFALVMAIGLMGAGVAYAASEDTVIPEDKSTQEQPMIRERAGTVVREGFEALTDGQKAELYAITDQQEVLHEQVLDKLVEFGVLDQETADSLKERHAERYSEMKENGSFFGGPEGRGKGGGRGQMKGSRGRNGGTGFNGDCPMTEASETAPEIEATDFN